MGLQGPAARLAGLLDPAFLAEAGWDPVTRVLSLPARHRLLGTDQAANVITGTTLDLVGTIGCHVLANLMPDRRLRARLASSKRAISK